MHTHQGLSAVRAHFPGLQSVLYRLLSKEKSVAETMKADSSSFGNNTASLILLTYKKLRHHNLNRNQIKIHTQTTGPGTMPQAMESTTLSPL